MRSVLILSMFSASLAFAGWGDFEETRELSLDAGGLASLAVNAGAGSLVIEGDRGADAVSVTAIIRVPTKNEDKAREIIAEHLVLSLVEKGDGAVLEAYFEEDGWSWGDSPSIAVEVTVPQRFSLDVEDSSGSIQIHDVDGDLSLNDGSGSIKMSNMPYL